MRRRRDLRHDRLDAGEGPAVTRARGDFGEIVTASRLLMREGEDGGAGDLLAQQRLVPARAGEHPASHQRAEKRLDDERLAELFEHHRDVEAGAAEPARALSEQGADDAEFRQCRPMLCGPARVRSADRVTRIDRIALLQIAAKRIGEHLPVFAMIEIHSQSSSIALVMISRWISFEPPKIESLRLLKYSTATAAA